MNGMTSCAPAAALTLGAFLLSGWAALAASTCPDERATPQTPKDPALCQKLEPIVRNPSAYPLDEYETALNEYLQALCHRDVKDGKHGWKRDKYVRDTGPWVGVYRDGKWTGQYYGTHAPVLIWYSPDFYEWLKANRPEDRPPPANPQPVPDGAMMVKEMYTPPAANCAAVDAKMLLPVIPGAAVMVRDSKGANDGWFWGWYAWAKTAGWDVDWPAKLTSPYPNMGFGQYCTNCHASAKDNQTFAALKNIDGEPGTPLVFLSQNFFLDPSWQNLQARVVQSANTAAAAGAPEPPDNPVFAKVFPPRARPTGVTPKLIPDLAMPAATYDNVWVKPGAPTAASQFITSDQCIGCHSAGGTGIQFDMTQPATDTKLLNISPYGTWRGSPMGLAGRDPIFFAQLASEVDTFHKEASPFVQDTCLGCHGILGQRQNAIDSHAQSGKCAPLARSILNAVPYKAPDPAAKAAARYGALGRDGISCAACHHMVLGTNASVAVANDPQNICVKERQDALNPDFAGFASTFTGSFFVGPPDKLYGPFEEPKVKPMKNALGVEPAHSTVLLSSELCGSCHTVHLPILKDGKPIEHVEGGVTHVYEQTTYPEWAFSDFRTGVSPYGLLPHNAGPEAQSCQDCHMPNKDALGNPYRSKIASIQEYTSFPQAEHTLDPKEIDLKERAGFGKHTLVGLNVFFLMMAQQFPEVLGVRPVDPMLTKKGIDSIPAALDAMIDQGVNRTATVTIGEVANIGTSLHVRVNVINRAGHKFPSGVGFRRAFLEFNVLDVNNKKLWSSGSTDTNGIIVDADGKPIAGEKWWKDDCSARIEPDKRIHQPHYQEIAHQDQAQIYQELVSTPPDGVAAPKCGPGIPAAGQLTTSFLSICTKVKDNRLLPRGFLSLDKRIDIARALGADALMAKETDPVGIEDDPDFTSGGSDSLVYRVSLAELKAKPAAVQATLYYQATPPFYLQDRFCTSHSDDTLRLYSLAGRLNLGGSLAEGWKLRVVTSGPVPVP
jgi:hypothetical protein